MFRSSLAVRANWQKNCQQQDASSARELRPKSFTWDSDSVNAHLSLPFRTLLLTVLRLYGTPFHDLQIEDEDGVQHRYQQERDECCHAQAADLREA